MVAEFSIADQFYGLDQIISSSYKKALLPYTLTVVKAETIFLHNVNITLKFSSLSQTH